MMAGRERVRALDDLLERLARQAVDELTEKLIRGEPAAASPIGILNGRPVPPNAKIWVDTIANLGLPRGAGIIADRIWGLPVVVDPSLPPGTIEIRAVEPELDFFRRRPRVELEDFRGGAGNG